MSRFALYNRLLFLVALHLWTHQYVERNVGACLPRAIQGHNIAVPGGGSQALRIPKKHLDLALGRCFQAEKIQMCPQFCPQ